jgi:hypothetical protein
MGSLDKIPDLALEADVGNESLAGFGIDTREVARVGIAVGVGILNVEEEDEVVAVFHDFGLDG